MIPSAHHPIQFILLPLLPLLLLAACGPSRPEGTLSAGEMEDVLYDYHVAQGMAEVDYQGAAGTLEDFRQRYYEAVFDRHGITQEIFDSSMAYYSSDLAQLGVIYQRVHRRVASEADVWAAVASTGQDIYAQLSTIGDTANVWTAAPLLVVKPRATENFVQWTMQCDTTWHPGDDIIWRFRTTLLSRDIRVQAFADLVVAYTNDSVRSYHASFSAQDQAEFRVRNAKGWTPRQVNGHVYLPSNTNPQEMCYFILSHIALIRIHKEVALPVDTLATDSTLQLADTSPQDTDTTARQDTIMRTSRQSPLQVRESQETPRTIQVVKTKPYKPHTSKKKSFTR